MRYATHLEWFLKALSPHYRAEPYQVESRNGNVWRFEGSRLSIEIEFDDREQTIFVLLVLMRDGVIPDGYYRDSRGAKCRIHLNTALATLGFPTKKYGQLALDDQCSYLAVSLQTLMQNLNLENVDLSFE